MNSIKIFFPVLFAAYHWWNISCILLSSEGISFSGFLHEFKLQSLPTPNYSWLTLFFPSKHSSTEQPHCKKIPFSRKT